MSLVFFVDSAAQQVYHWKNVAIGGGSYVTGITFHPKEKGLVYIKTDIGGCYRWNEPEGRWIPLTDHFTIDQGGCGGQTIAIDPGNTEVVYISVRRGTLLKSTDRGETWIESNLNTPMHGNGDLRWAGERLVVNPFDSQVILFGSRTEGLFKLTDGGISWESVGMIGSTTERIGILGIVFGPSSKGRVYANVYGDGIY